ncbi:MAG: ArsR/SmtB family transcription factor [bacterium]
MSASEAQANEQIDYHTIDEEDAEELKEDQVDRSELQDLEQRIKGLGNETRLRIISFLSQQDLCVHDLSTLLDMSQSAVSHQLKELRNQEILNRKKDGRVVFYSINENSLEEILLRLDEFLTD